MKPATILYGFALPTVVFEIMRVVAATLGAVAAWFIAAPLARLVSRLIFQRTLPEGGQLLSRLAGAGIAAVLILAFFPRGWGPGGGGTGTGNGTGDGVGTGVDKGKGKDKTGTVTTTGTHTGTVGIKPAPDSKVLLIEVLGGKRYVPGSSKPYLLHRKEPAVKLEDVLEFLDKKETREKYNTVIVVITPDTNKTFRQNLTDHVFVGEKFKNYNRQILTEAELPKELKTSAIEWPKNPGLRSTLVRIRLPGPAVSRDSAPHPTRRHILS